MDLEQKIELLSQLRVLQKEVNLLSQRVAELELVSQGKGGRVTGLPGRPPENCGKLLEALWRRLDARRTRCLELIGALYTFIDDIDDSLMRQIMIYRYVDGRSWQSVARKIGEVDEQYPRRQHNQYLKRASLGIFDENDEEKLL